MGLLDSIVGAVAGGGQGGGGNGMAQLLPALLQMLNNGQQGGGSPLGGLVAQLTQGGLGDAVQSWISTGQNMPVSAEQLQSALGGANLQQLAQQFGIDPSQIAGQLSQQLPGLVDQMTPQGQLPTGGLQDVLGSLSGLLNR
jgi:uncharacterized protein YidB (DUF937 family)